MKPPHVVQLIETDGPGGAEQVLINLAQQLNRSENTRASVGLFPGEGWLQQRLKEENIPVQTFSSRHAFDLPFLGSLMRWLHHEKVQLIHSHEFTMNLYAALAGGLLGIPVVATVHGKNYYSTATRRIQAMRLLRRWGANVVAVSSDLQDFLERDLGLRNVRLIPNGIDVAAYSGIDRDAVRRELGFGEKDKVIGAVGNLYPVKGHAVLLRALAELEDPRIHVVIAGRGAEEPRLGALAESLSLQNRVHLLGFRKDVPRLLSAFDVYALPSFSEGQSLALMEAMAAGLPIVASRVGGNPELIQEGEDGLLFEAGNVKDLASKLRTLLALGAPIEAMEVKAFQKAVRDFSLEAMMSRYRDLYAELGLKTHA
jgi:glycosyltransferase involved in cell wall biosynthesis